MNEKAGEIFTLVSPTSTMVSAFRDTLGDPQVKMVGRPSADRYRSLQRQEATDQSLQRQEATEAGSGLPAGHCWLKIALPSFMDLIQFNYI